MNRFVDTVASPKKVRIGDSFTLSVDIKNDGPLIVDTRKMSFEFIAEADSRLFRWVKRTGDGINASRPPTVNITIDSADTSLAFLPCRVRWELKVVQDDNRYTVAHGKVILTNTVGR